MELEDERLPAQCREQWFSQNEFSAVLFLYFWYSGVWVSGVSFLSSSGASRLCFLAPASTRTHLSQWSW